MDMIDRIKRIQQFLNVPDDGVIGPQTITAAEKKIGLIPKNIATTASSTAIPDGNHLAVSETSVSKLISFEVSSEAFYNKRLSRPVWPGGKSGVTIGIGYDLGFNSRPQIDKSWRNEVNQNDLHRLKSVSGIKGIDAKGATRTLRDIKISFDSASTVFHHDTLPRYAALVRKTYPGVEKLPADAQGAILSLVYNRGSKLTGSTRREMAAIRGHIADENLDAIADQLIEMRRLWPNTAGLLKRRSDEADLVRNSQRRYRSDEIIVI